MSTTIWAASAVTPAATDRIPVDVSGSGGPSRWTGQQVADVNTLIGGTVTALGSISTNTALNLALGGYFSATVTGNLTFSITNVPASAGVTFVLALTNGGAFTVTLPGSVTIIGGSPVLSASGTDWLVFRTLDGGTAWTLEVVGNPRDADLATWATITPGTGVGTALGTNVGSAGAFVVNGGALGTPSSGTLTNCTFPAISGLTGFTAAENTSSPNATVPVASLTANNAATNVDAALCPKGAGAILARIPDSTATGGNKRGAYAVDFQTSRWTASQVASGYASAVLGGEGNTASGVYAVVAGGNGNTASGTWSFVGAGISNVASGTHSAIGSGQSNTASGNHSWIPGGHHATTRGITAGGAYGMSARSAVGDRQTMVLPIACAARTDATATVMTSDAGAASATNQMVLPNNSSMFFEVDVVAHDSSLKSASWKVQGTIRRGANAAATAIVGTNVTTTFGSDLSGGSPGVTCTADTTNGALQVTFTGIAATTIYPSGHIRTVIAA